MNGKPTLNLLSSFTRVEEADGGEHFAGTLSLAALRKAKVKEIEVVLMPVKAVPRSLVGLMDRAGAEKAEYLLFASVGAGNKE